MIMLPTCCSLSRERPAPVELELEDLQHDGVPKPQVPPTRFAAREVLHTGRQRANEAAKVACLARSLVLLGPGTPGQGTCTS